MKLEEALRIAIDFEHKVRDHYAHGAGRIKDPAGKRVFAVLAKEEQGHVDYLEACLAAWSKEGHVHAGTLRTTIKEPAWVKDANKKRRQTTGRVADKHEIELLKTALKLEDEARAFYGKLAHELPAAERELFAPFLTIEEGHVAVVQAQLDSVSGLGFWFDVMEFSLEGQ